MPTIHWAGTGLSAIPGLRRLIENGHTVVVYNRTLAKAHEALSGLEGRYKACEFSLETLRDNAKAGDVLVSMLPGDFHVPLAEIALSNNAHFVSSSYIADPMRELDAQAKAQNLCLVNEVGLDPGIDHSMAHALVNDYMASAAFAKDNAHSFFSYCGGLSKIPNDFCYKFSWAPLGVLKALMSPSVSVRDGKDFHVSKPWDAVDNYTVPMPWGAETFEVYPNRDSRPFMAQYHFGEDWNTQQFVRGTLRLKGWTKAWADIFTEVETLEGEAGDKRLAELSNELWQKNALEDGEADRVVLTVELKAEKDGEALWHKSFLMDAFGNDQGTAMARLVSIPVSLAIEAVLNSEIPVGVSAAPRQEALVERWLDTVDSLADHLTLVDHLA
ncbi:MAG: saccharopine dehydrogenase-like NADP-dependent oxidoreductase [Parvicella sp.]|jgi:saccharopine dehydrogenase-like NADP-dependent oxidoreductase